jgi:hypothetical protein
MYEKMNLLEFQERFATEEACLSYLMQKRWPEGFVCPRCGGQGGYWLQHRRLMECRQCRYQASSTAGTIFHKTRVPLRYWFWTIFLMSRCKAGYSMKGLQKLLGIGSYRTVWMMGHKIRQAMAKRNDCYQLSHLVELDDSFFGGRRRGRNRRGRKRGRGTEGKAKVLAAVEITKAGGPRFLSLDVVDDITSDNVKRVAWARIDPGAQIRSDAYHAFVGLAQAGYQHERVRLEWVGMGFEQFPWVHTLISNCKTQLQGTQKAVSLKHLQRYLAEFCYRFNRRFWESELFDRLLTACSLYPTVTYPELSA